MREYSYNHFIGDTANGFSLKAIPPKRKQNIYTPMIEDYYPPLGIVLAVVLFPIG